MEHDKFDLIKLIRDNRFAILYCTLLARAQTPAEKAAIEATMASDDDLAPILDALKQVCCDELTSDLLNINYVLSIGGEL